MNRLNAHLYLPLVAHLAHGGTIQANRKHLDGADNWVDLEEGDGTVMFTCPPEGYRIKPNEQPALSHPERNACA